MHYTFRLRQSVSQVVHFPYQNGFIKSLLFTICSKNSIELFYDILALKNYHIKVATEISAGV
jgi:hypothetical protein